MKARPRILYISWTTPGQQSGACLAMRRHFVEADDLETFVLSNESVTEPSLRSLAVPRPRVLDRLMRTRFRRFFRQYEMLSLGRRLLPQALRIAEAFRPHAIFTIPDNDVSWCASLLARRLQLPLITNFQDWWPHNQYWSETDRPYSCTRRIIERRFRLMYRQSALAFCTSQGMKEFLGPHPNSVVLYPCPGKSQISDLPKNTPKATDRFVLIYAGTIRGDYGRQLLALAREICARTIPIDLVLFGHPPDWSQEDLEWAKSKGIYRGFLLPERLRETMITADAFLTVMSFRPELEIMSRVSFTTKFLEYSQYSRPILVWGPEYCQPVRIAKETGAGLPIESPRAASVVDAINTLSDPAAYARLALGAQTAAKTVFSSDAIQSVFINSLLRILPKSKCAP